MNGNERAIVIFLHSAVPLNCKKISEKKNYFCIKSDENKKRIHILTCEFNFSGDWLWCSKNTGS